MTSSAVTTTTLTVILPAEGPTLSDETGVLLLLDDGIDGLTAVDPDRRLVGRSVVEGQRAGDEQYSMVRVGNNLVVGWGEPHAVDIATRQAAPLGSATIFVPAAEPGRVWMVDSGARIGSAPVRVWQVDVVTGEAIHEPLLLEGHGFVQIGITGGLALQTDSGLNLWTLERGQVVPLESTGPGFVHDVFDNRLVWCSGECTTLTMTNTETLETQEYPPPNGYDSFSYESRFSADGRYLAALIGHAGSPEATGIWILDRQTGPPTNVFPIPVQQAANVLPMHHGILGTRSLIADGANIAAFGQLGMEITIGIGWFVLAMTGFRLFSEGGRRDGTIDLAE